MSWGNSWGASWGGSWGGSAPDPVTVIGGAGRPIYKRRKWRELRQVVDENLQAAYEEIVAAGLPKEVTTEAVKTIKPFADKSARFKSVPKPDDIDWKAMQRDAQLARQLLEIHEEHIGRLAWERLLEEEDEFLLLN